MYVKAFQGAVESIKTQLPQGSLLGKVEARVAVCLPAIASSIYNIIE